MRRTPHDKLIKAEFYCFNEVMVSQRPNSEINKMINFSSSDLVRRVERGETFTYEEFREAVKQFSDGLQKVYDHIDRSLAPDIRELLYQLWDENANLTSLLCTIPEGIQ